MNLRAAAMVIAWMAIFGVFGAGAIAGGIYLATGDAPREALFIAGPLMSVFGLIVAMSFRRSRTRSL